VAAAVSGGEAAALAVTAEAVAGEDPAADFPVVVAISAAAAHLAIGNSISGEARAAFCP
jgi:hypothetical protein